MYKIEYQQDNGLVTSITDATETPVTLQDEGVAYYNGEIPEDREGFTKELYWGVDPEVNVNTKARIANSETLYAVYTPIEGWLELATMEYVSGVEGKIVQLEQNVNLLNRKPQGLKFKAGDNSVFAKTMKDLVFGTDDFTVCVVARTEGSNSIASSIIGNSKNPYGPNCFRIYGNTTYGSNRIDYLLMQRELDEQSNGLKNSVHIDKQDTTTNLHHIVITRSGTLVTCTINGRLVKSVTQDRVLDFSNFIYDMANTSYFWGGYVFNYAMTQAESNKLLWHGGRYDEVRLPEHMKIYNDNTTDFIVGDALGGTSTIVKHDGYIDVTINSGRSDAAYPRLYSTPTIFNKGCYCTVEIDCEPIGGEFILGKSSVLFEGLTSIENGQVVINKRTVIRRTGGTRYSGEIFTAIGNLSNVGKTLRIYSYKVVYHQALLEYRPENIRSDSYLNSGTAGSDYDLVYSAVKPEIIYEKPYADKVMLDENKAPDWHPIAMGQEVETPTNIFKAKLPDVGTEWQVSDWKQINN